MLFHNYLWNFVHHHKLFSQSAILLSFELKYLLIKNKSKINKHLLYLLGRGDIYFKNDSNHSDFFWLLNSNFPSENVLYSHLSNSESDILKKNNINITDKVIKWEKIKKKHYIDKLRGFDLETKAINKAINEYNYIYYYWYSFFKTYNVKIFLTWYLYKEDHIAIHKAINNNNGISAIWQLAFHGTPYIECRSVSDIYFTYSNLTNEINTKTGSKNKYQVITGYPKDYAFLLLNKSPKEIRKKLFSAGAKKL